MTTAFKRTIAGAAILVAGFGGVALSSSVASAAETAVFPGTGFAPLSNLSLAETNAVTNATVAANAAGFFNCPTHVVTSVTSPGGVKVWQVTVDLTCTR